MRTPVAAQPVACAPALLHSRSRPQQTLAHILSRQQSHRTRFLRHSRAATAEKDTEKQKEDQPSSGAAGSEQASTSGSTPQEDGEQDLASQLKRLRSDKPPVQTSGGIQGILEETLLIEWPKPLQAIKDTVVVISILAGTTVFLFVANSIFAELSSKYLRH